MWKDLVENTALWWPKHFYTMPEPTGFRVEGRPGGRVYEDAGAGVGAVWGTVAVWQPPVKMVWACEMYPGFGGPGRSFVTFTVEPSADGSTVRLHDAGMCPNPGQAAESLRAGWQELVGQHLKAYAESKPTAAGRVGLLSEAGRRG